MLVNMFSIDKKPTQPVNKAQPVPVQQQELKLKKHNDRLKKQIDMLYHVLVDKEAVIFNLKKFIREDLRKSEFDEIGYDLEAKLNEILQHEDGYDPRKQLNFISVERDIPEPDDDTSTQAMTPKKNISLQIETSMQNGHSGKDQILGESPVLGKTFLANQEQNSLSKMKSEGISSTLNLTKVDSEEYDLKRSYSLVKKNADIKKVPIKPMGPEIIARRLFCFELELKEYSPSTFDAIKQFVSKTSFTAEDIHDEIERLAEVAARQKYFHKVFPDDTVEKVAEELENYMFEVLHSKLFVVDEDVRGFSQQFRDRLNVLKGFVTFDMLEIAVPMRKASLYTQAIAEFEKVSQYKTPVWKLQSFQNCVNHVLNIFNETVQRTPSSDELFPVLVYVVLQANTELLRYNIDYIYSYLRKCHLMGQLGFLIVNLKAVVQFLQDVNGNSLFQGKLEMKKF